jgi:hypothetical protein
MTNLGFSSLMEMLKEQVDLRCKTRDGDVFIVISGDEGTGKSLLAMAIASYVDPEYDIDRIFYRWKEYQKLLKAAMKTKVSTFDQERVKKNFKEIGVNYDNLMKNESTPLPPGSALQYDEAGSGMSNRKALDKETVEQYLALQRMRHLSMVNIWCCPKLQVIDRYARNERVKFFIYVEDEGTLREPKRVAHVWSRPSLRRMYSDFNWQQTFLQGIKLVVSKYRPDYSVILPNLTGHNRGSYYIKPQLLEDYRIRKVGYDLKLNEEEQDGLSEDGKNSLNKLIKVDRKELSIAMEKSGVPERTVSRYLTTLDKIMAAASDVIS